MSLVVDASATIAWLLGEPIEDEVQSVFDELAVLTAYVPAIWWYETQHVALIAARRNRITEAERDAMLADLALLPIAIEAFAPRSAVTELAARHRLSVYDAAYLELALRRAQPLVTLDNALARAAAVERIPTLGAGS